MALLRDHCPRDLYKADQIMEQPLTEPQLMQYLTKTYGFTEAQIAAAAPGAAAAPSSAPASTPAAAGDFVTPTGGAGPVT